MSTVCAQRTTDESWRTPCRTNAADVVERRLGSYRVRSGEIVESHHVVNDLPRWILTECRGILRNMRPTQGYGSGSTRLA